MDANTIPGTLPAGTRTHLGTIERSSLTAYLIDGAWVSFDRVHGKPQPVTPLVRLESDCCERSTPGCSVIHSWSPSDAPCETW